MVVRILFYIFINSSVIFCLSFAQNTQSIQKQWKVSPHAESMNTPEERNRMNKTGCAHCHTAQGYWEVILEGKKSTAPYKDAQGITCVACHNQSNESNPAKLRVQNVEDACSGCHDILVENKADYLSWCPQGSIVLGKGGAEFTDHIYDNGEHSKLNKKCVTCHMAKPFDKTLSQEIGGHTFRVITKGKTPKIFNNSGCTECHETIDLEFVETSQDSVKKLLAILADLLPKKNSKNKKASEQEPKFPKDPSLNEVQAKAAFNYWMIVKDGTFGVHNPLYTRRLLNDSIEAMKELNMNN